VASPRERPQALVAQLTPCGLSSSLTSRLTTELNGKVYVADEIDEILPLINEDFLRKAYTGEISLHMGYVLEEEEAAEEKQ
jgi:hypothetical protein